MIRYPRLVWARPMPSETRAAALDADVVGLRLEALAAALERAPSLEIASA